MTGNCYITINGKQYRCAFTMLQMELMSKLTAQYDTNTEIGACLPYAALQVAARQDKITLDLEFEDIFQWYDDAVTNDSEELKTLNAAFAESTVYKRFVEPTLTEAQKKSLSIMMNAEPLALVS